MATLGFWACRATHRRAAVNTLRCLAGCSLGDFSALVYLQTQHPTVGPAVAVPAAMCAGIATSLALETGFLAFGKDKMPLVVAARTAFNMSFISMSTMELAENAVEIALTGGDFSNPAAYLALVPATTAGFLAPYPYNYYQLKKHGRACH